MTTTVDLSVIIVNRDVREYLRGCLGSLAAYTRDITYEVFVVDNASSDGSAGMVRREFPSISVIANGQNRGYAAANNQALVLARGRYILFLNPDTEVRGNALGEMTRYMDGRSGTDGIGPKLLHSDGSLQESCRHFPSVFTDLMEATYLDWLFPRNPFCNYYRMALRMPDTVRTIDVPYGACLLVRRDSMERVGPMDDGFFMYYDEIDLCYRMRRRGMRIEYVPHIEVIHHGNKSSDKAYADCSAWKRSSKVRYFGKHYGAWGLAGLLCNTGIRFVIVWFGFSLAYLVTGRPRNLEEIKEGVRMDWRLAIRAAGRLL